LEQFELNKAIIALMECAEFLQHQQALHSKALELLTLMLVPFVPHVAEELWEKLGKKPFACTQKWPAFDEKKINPELEYIHTLYESIKADINGVLKITNILKPMAIKLFVADNWKHELYKEVKAQLDKTRNAGEIIKTLMGGALRKHGDTVSKLVPKLVQDPGRITAFVLGQKKELAAYTAMKEQLAKDYNCSIEIVKEQDSQEPKAKNALPGRPAMVIA
jgi:leucyl-tRNA synthetase